MSYVLNQKYRIKSESGMYLNVYGNEVVSNFRNVCLWEKSNGAYSQGWYIIQKSGSKKIVTALDDRYGLDHFRGSDNYGNCDIYKEDGNDTDSAIMLEEVRHNSNIYKIRLANHSNRYLTANGKNKGSDVRWEALNNTDSQQWRLEEWPTITKYIPGMYTIYNQHYKNNENWIKTYGCAACCGCNINSFYSRTTYTIAQAKSDGMYNTSSGVDWTKVKYANCTLSTQNSQAAYLTKIREQVSLKKPVLVHVARGKYEHWIVAYGYTDEGNTTSKILVLDPYNEDKNKINGVDRTLYQSMDISYDCFTIKELRLTSAK